MKIYMSLLYACSLSLYIEGTQPNEVIYYTDNSLRDDIVSKWILNTAKKKKIIHKSYIANAKAVTNATILTVRQNIILKRQKTDDEPVIYVDNPVEARLPCRWIRRSMLREVIKQRGKGNVKDNAKLIEDLTKLCRSQTEVIKNFKAKLPETTKEPVVVVENPVEANIACPLISRSKLMKIILNRAKDNVNGIVKTAEDSVFFRLPSMCATEQGGLQIEGDTDVQRPLRNTCMTLLHQVTPRNTLEPSTTNYITIFSTKSRNAFEPISKTTMPTDITRKATTLTIPSTTPDEIITLYMSQLPELSIINTDIPSATQRNILEPDLTSTTTYTKTSLTSPRSTIEPKALSVSINATKNITTHTNSSTNTANTYTTRVSTSQRDSIVHIILSASADTGRLKTSQRNTFEPNISRITTTSRSSTSLLSTFDLIQLPTSGAVDYSRSITTPSINFQPIVTNTNVYTTTSTTLKEPSKPSVIHATKLSSILNLFTAMSSKRRIKRTKTHKNRRVKTTTEPSFSYGRYQY